MSAVRLYLDIDGVLNAWHPEDAWPDSEIRNVDVAVDIDGYRGLAGLTWAADLIDALASLDVELVWATTWTTDAPTVAAGAFGFGAGQRFLSPLDGRMRAPSIAWKEEAVIADQLASPSPFIWVDDELTLAHVERVADLFGDRALIVCSDHGKGITSAQIAGMRAFVKSWRKLEAKQIPVESDVEASALPSRSDTQKMAVVLNIRDCVEQLSAALALPPLRRA
jgi:hypothetical protein